MDNKDMILADLITRDNAHNGYYEKLGILKLINEAPKTSFYVLNNLKKIINTVDELIKDYKLAGNDLNNEITFKELQIKVNSLFKLKFKWFYVVTLIVIILLIIIL